MTTEVQIPDDGTPEFDELVKRAAEARYPQMFKQGLPENELESLLGVAAKWVKAVAEASVGE